MRKSLSLITAAVLAVILGACEPSPDRDGPTAESIELALENYDRRTSDTTIGDIDGPAVDRGTARPLNDTERERLDSWNGTGDQPFGDSPNDGRFRDVTCEGTGTAAYGYTGGVACFYDDGTPATEGVDYRAGFWYWADTPISASGQCPSEDSCLIAWSHAETRPVVVSAP